MSSLMLTNDMHHDDLLHFLTFDIAKGKALAVLPPILDILDSGNKVCRAQYLHLVLKVEISLIRQFESDEDQ